jgi:hypothetical protein
MRSLTHRVFVYKDGYKEIIPVSYRIYKVKPDQETERWNFQVRPVVIKEDGTADDTPMPAVFPTGEIDSYLDFRRNKFTEKWQIFAADLLSMKKYGLRLDQLGVQNKSAIITAFNSIYKGNRFLNNDHGVERYNNYITGETDRGEDPLIDPLICASNVIHTGLPVKNIKNILMVQIDGFLDTDIPPVVTNETLNDSRILNATIIKGDGSVVNFTQLMNGDSVPYPYIRTKEEGFYPVVDLQVL